MFKILSAILLVFLSLTLTACGNNQKTKITISAPKTKTVTPVPERAITANLSISLTQIGSKTRLGAGMETAGITECTLTTPAQCHLQVRCPAAKRSKQDEICVYLTAHQAELFKPVAKGQACTEIYGGPEKANITGIVADKPVAINLTRVNGCQIAQWDLHSQLWGLKS